MKNLLFTPILLLMSVSIIFADVDVTGSGYYSGGEVLSIVELPKPEPLGGLRLGQLLSNRGGKVNISPEQIPTGKIGQVFWAGYGFTSSQAARSVGSFDNGYSLLLYLVTDSGVYVYVPAEHNLAKVVDTDLRSKLAAAAGRDKAIYIAKTNIVVAGSPRKAGHKRPRDGRLFMHIEAGKVMQNMELEALNQGLGFIPNVNLSASKISFMLKMPSGFEPICILTVGELEESIKPAPQQTQAISAPAEQPAIEAKPQPQEPVEKAAPKVLIFVPAANFPEQPYTEITNLFANAGAEVSTASTTRQTIRGDLRGELTPDHLVSDLYDSKYDAVIIIGSTLSSRAFRQDDSVLNFTARAYNKGAVVASYGRGVEILARSGILRGGLRVTGDAGQRRIVVQNGGEYVEQAIVVDGRIVSAKEIRSAEISSLRAGPTGTTGLVSKVLELMKE
jgi:putative intracellular protease/amidase/nitroreductase